MKPQKQTDTVNTSLSHPADYVFANTNISAINNFVIFQHSSEQISTDQRGYFDLLPQVIDLDFAIFSNLSGMTAPKEVEIRQTDDKLILTCPCKALKNKLCEHQTQVLFNVIQRNEIRVFFDEMLRYEKIRKAAIDYGLENEKNLDSFFQLEYANKSVEIKPKLKELLPVNPQMNNYLEENLLPQSVTRFPRKENIKTVLVFAKHRYYDHLNIELYQAPETRDGKLKNPLKEVSPFDFIWKTDQSEEIKFYTSVSKFQNNYNTDKSESDIEGLKALVRNPLDLDVYFHDTNISVNITSTSIVPVQLKFLLIDIRLLVNLKNNFYEVSGELIVNDKSYELKHLQIRYHYFIFINQILYLIDNPDVLRIIEFFKKNNHKILIHESRFEEFRETILSRLEDKIRITYAYLKPATPEQLEETGFDNSTERIIYLKDLEHYVEITPVMRYGNVEVPVFSKKQIYANDANGNVFTVERDNEAEVKFTTTLMRQHPDFAEQLNNDCFYLPRERFLDENWFLEAFEAWQSQEITVLGFNELKNNRFNQNKARISIEVTSGINWFDTAVNVKFGQQNASLKHLHKSIRNKSKFVQLDDGTLGILPEEWIEKFARYFQSGEVVEEKIRTPKINFSSISEMYEEEVLATETRNELAVLQSKISDFSAISHVTVPKDLKTTLREYQHQGLNWLNFLDGFGFGACLADDMGLGKTVQIIAFILSQRAKVERNTNLIVVPTSLIFNWQDEVAKFAPSIRLLTIYGSNRMRNCKDFDEYEIVLTSYGTLQSDIRFLKEYQFNYVILDESQAIKNPESQRYKTVRLLQSRNKIVMTGTPVENNTFDLYGQLSFACPGLLGSKQYFKDLYSMPIDKFKDSRRAAELQKKVNPFILRRTKEQVATELPDKTEMIIYCEMGEKQRKIYDSYEREFREFISLQSEEDVSKNSMYVLQGLTKLRQICDSPALLQEGIRLSDSSSKIDTLLEEIENKSPRHKILVFSQFVTMLDLIREKLQERNIPFEYLTGQTRDRAKKVDNFQTKDEIRVFLISLKAGGTGLNLTEADYVYLVDPWWNPAVENQAIDRSYRIGQNKKVVAVRLICPNTIESKMMTLQESKKVLANDLIKTDTSIFKSLSKTDLMGLFG